jgi:hypothetical protein
MELVRSEFAVRCTRHSQSSGYIYTSFQKTAKIWWDPWQGGDGAIYSTIDGSGSGYPIAEVNNCSRIIKYVVTVGQRYSSYSLVDMRVHDINVVADLTRHDPTAPNPEENDGTVRGLKPCAAAVSFVDSMVSMSASNTVSWWTGWWPVIHVKTFGSLESGASFSYQIAVDLLGTVSLEDMSIATAREDGYDDATIQAMVNQGDADFLAELGMGLTLIAAEIILVVAIELLTHAMDTSHIRDSPSCVRRTRALSPSDDIRWLGDRQTHRIRGSGVTLCRGRHSWNYWMDVKLCSEQDLDEVVALQRPMVWHRYQITCHMLSFCPRGCSKGSALCVGHEHDTKMY